jgi:hypothetical protein
MIEAIALPTVTTLCGYLICFLIGALGIAVLWLIFTGQIDLSRLISEPTGDASMGRFQFLIFTFVISLSLFLVIVSGKKGDPTPAFPDNIPGGILTLLGISGSSYAVGKAIQFSDAAGIEDRPVTVTITPAKAAVHYKATQQFKADVARKPDAKVNWAVVAGPGTVDADTGLYSAPAAAAVPPAPYATVQATCVDYPDVTDLAVIMLA